MQRPDSLSLKSIRFEDTHGGPHLWIQGTWIRLPSKRHKRSVAFSTSARRVLETSHHWTHTFWIKLQTYSNYILQLTTDPKLPYTLPNQISNVTGSLEWFVKWVCDTICDEALSWSRGYKHRSSLIENLFKGPHCQAIHPVFDAILTIEVCIKSEMTFPSCCSPCSQRYQESQIVFCSYTSQTNTTSA